MVLFELEGFGDTFLTPVLYIIQSVWCLLVFVPFLFILRCWQKFTYVRNTRCLFTLYLSGIDSASRLIFFVYYLLRLIMIYNKGLWVDEDRGVIDLYCNRSSPNHLIDSNGDHSNTTWQPTTDPCSGENMISRQNCLTFSLFLYWASTWPMTSIVVLQIHALIASIIPEKYERRMTFKLAISTMSIAFLIDLILGVCAYEEIKITYIDDDQPEIMDACKFEYFSRLSIINSSYVFVLLCTIGIMTLVQLAIACFNRRRQKKFVNAAANSPVHGWTTMSLRERTLTVTIMSCGITSFILFIIHFIVYLVQGNSLLRQILNITISVFSFIGPIELMWFNVDIRKAIFILLFGADQKTMKKESETGLKKSIDANSDTNSTEIETVSTGGTDTDHIDHDQENEAEVIRA